MFLYDVYAKIANMEVQKQQHTIAKPVMETDAKRKRRAILAVCALILTAVAMFFFVGKPMLRFAGDTEQFRAWVDAHGVWGKAAFVGMMVLQIIVAFIPGEPLEIAAGYAFGVLEGTLLCMLGAFIGGVLVFLLVKKFGVRLVSVFFSPEKILQNRFLQDEKQRNLLAFFLFLIPGTPKDVLTYFVGLTDMSLSTWMFITTFARIPSIITSTIGGSAMGLENYQFAILVFAITLLISLVGLFAYRAISKRRSRSEKIDA